uniref:Uncharacterized protein n=1 Tax=Romanomermis culicivorax TaxID=13658 RepID=A0A915HPU3_ROMCU
MLLIQSCLYWERAPNPVPGSSRLYSHSHSNSSFDFVVIIWHVASGDVVYKLGGMMAPVSSLCLTSNDTFLVIACADETLRVFSLCLAKELHELRGHQGNIVSLIIGPDDCQLFAGSADGSIYCYDLHTGQMVATQKCATTTIFSLKITNGNRFLLSTGGDSIQVWNIDRPIDSWKSENSPTITVCTMSKDCKYLAVGNSTGSVFLWDLESCRYLWAVSYEFKVKITCLSFDYGNDLIFSGSIDGLICIWSILGGRLKKSIRRVKSPNFLSRLVDNHHTAMIRNIQFFQNKPRVLSHDSTGIVKIWRPFPVDSDDDCKDAEEINVGGDLLQLANDRDLIVTTSYSSKELKMWNIGSDDTAAYVRAKFGHKDAITCLKMSSNGKFVLTGSKDNSIKLWEVSTGYLTQVFVGHETPVISCGMNDDNQVAVSGSVDGSVYSWDVETGSTMSTVNYHPKVEVNSVALFNDGLIVLSGYSNGWLHASTTETGQEIAGFNAHLPILEILNGREGSRIILRLSQGPRLAVVCLHNCPTLSEVFVDNNGVKRRRRSSRALSLTSAGSEGCASMNSVASTNITASINRCVSPLVTLKGIATAACPPSTATSSVVPPTYSSTTSSSSKFPLTPLSTTTMLDDEKRQQSLTTPSIEKSVVTSFADKRSESRSSKVFATIEHNRSSQSCLLEDQLFCGSSNSQKFTSGKSYNITDRPSSSNNQNISK